MLLLAVVLAQWLNGSIEPIEILIKGEELVNARCAGVVTQVKQRWEAGDVLVRTGMQVSITACPWLVASPPTAPSWTRFARLNFTHRHPT